MDLCGYFSWFGWLLSSETSLLCAGLPRWSEPLEFLGRFDYDLSDCAGGLAKVDTTNASCLISSPSYFNCKKVIDGAVGARSVKVPVIVIAQCSHDFFLMILLQRCRDGEHGQHLAA